MKILLNMLAVEDAKLYLKALSKSNENKDIDNQSKSKVEFQDCRLSDESELLTQDDVARARLGLPPQRYDAYLLFDSDNDIDFATQIIEKMEIEYKLKVNPINDIQSCYLITC